MMGWQDEGALLSVRRHGEGSAIIEVFTRAHGRHMGVVRGGGSRKMAPLLQPGAQLRLEWRARLSEHMGSFIAEPIRSRAHDIMADRGALAALGAMSALLSGLPERDAHPGLYDRTIALLDALGTSADWPARYALWECALLAEMGFGMDLSRCAATGTTAGLVYVSPRSGQAVSAAGAGAWADRLLPLPQFLRDDQPQASPEQVMQALSTTGHFLNLWLMPALGRAEMPDARARLLAILARARG